MLILGKYLFSLLLLFPFALTSQNLVKNGDFEEWTSKPNGSDELNKAVGWQSSGTGTPDYYVRGSDNPGNGIPDNMMGYMESQSGDAYAGFSGYSYMESLEVREYVQGSLIKPLETGKQYCVSFFIALSTRSKITIPSVGLSFVTHFEKVEHASLLPLEEHISNTKTTKSTWQKVCEIYQAKGGEDGFIIGSFMKSTAKYTEEFKLNYYYVDNVSVVETSPSKSCPCSNSEERLLAGEAIVLENIYFESGKSILLPSSYAELNKFYKVLADNKSYALTITGHTDNIGTKEDNQLLSSARAKAVAKYLIDKGIDPNRISTKGAGSTSPIASNSDEAGRKLNRRVEFQLVKQ